MPRSQQARIGAAGWDVRDSERKQVMALKALIEAATAARQQAYVPYSNFAVGAALLTQTGQIVTGCNIENASYGLTTCAERTVLFKAVSEGERDFRALAVVGNTLGPITPCGACRQVMAELCPPELTVYLANLAGKTLETTVKELLPYVFDQEALYGKRER
jgi:cytidine deaminase